MNGKKGKFTTYILGALQDFQGGIFFSENQTENHAATCQIEAAAAQRKKGALFSNLVLGFKNTS